MFESFNKQFCPHCNALINNLAHKARKCSFCGGKFAYNGHGKTVKVYDIKWEWNPIYSIYLKSLIKYLLIITSILIFIYFFNLFQS